MSSTSWKNSIVSFQVLILQRRNGSILTDTKRMAESDGTTLGIDLLDINADCSDAVEGLGRESLVDLEDVDVVDLKTSLLEDGGDSEGGANTHDLGRN